MPRSIWNGTISFGMVSIPVSLFTATEEKDVSFHMLHKDCHSRIKQLRWCPVCSKEAGKDDIQKGYEYATGQHVIMEPTDFEDLPVPSIRTIEVTTFVRAEEIDPVFYDKCYYVQPSPAGKKPFALLLRALEDKKVTAVAKVALRNKEHLCALRPKGGAIVLETLFYPDEIRAAEELTEDILVSDAELAMANSLIDLLAGRFEPEQYKDGYREALLQRIEAKMQGGEIVAAPEAEATQVIDLMEALKASIQAAKKEKTEATG